MKVLALNSSARPDGQSKTKLLLDHLVVGMQDAGAEVEVVDLRKKNIKNCIGCFTCWTKTPGICIHNDDMTAELYPKWLDADLVIYATPLYHFTLNAQLKTFIERTLPILQPFLMEYNDKTSHPLRRRHPKAVFLSVAGFPECTVFDQLSSWANFVFGWDGNLLAEIYRPNAEMLSQPVVKNKAEEILAATRQAGKEIVESLKVTPETMARITQDIIEDKYAFSQMGNLMWKTCIAEGLTPKEFQERGLVPRPDSIETFLMLMSFGFNPQAAENTKATIQFNFTGEVTGQCWLTIDSSSITSAEGSAENPDLTVNTPFEVWMDITTGKADGAQMFMEQKYSVEGDANLLMQIDTLFSS